MAGVGWISGIWNIITGGAFSADYCPLNHQINHLQRCKHLHLLHGNCWPLSILRVPPPELASVPACIRNEWHKNISRGQHKYIINKRIHLLVVAMRYPNPESKLCLLSLDFWTQSSPAITENVFLKSIQHACATATSNVGQSEEMNLLGVYGIFR